MWEDETSVFNLQYFIFCDYIQILEIVSFIVLRFKYLLSEWSDVQQHSSIVQWILISFLQISSDYP